jgi:UDP-GlcNAc3NAcA epimerase
MTVAFLYFGRLKPDQMLKILTIIGARPQIIKAAALSRAIRNTFADKIQEVIVHTGQHYDTNMSQVFFDELGIPKPDYNLKIGSASHGRQTGKMIESIEEVLLKESPDYVVVYGDTNSTLAASVAASKIHVPIVHIEAGLRSFNKSMPEEINRIMCDHASTLLFTPTVTGLKNLLNEGFSKDTKPPYSPDNPGVFHCGDVMYDNSLHFQEEAASKSQILKKLDLLDKPFLLGTIHRDNNTDQPERLNNIFTSLNTIAAENEVLVVLPLHPRTLKALEKNLDRELLEKVEANPFMSIIPAVSFLEIIMLESHCEMVFTDSGGVQKEAWFFEKPSIILRSETEWVEIVEHGNGIIADADPEAILDAYHHFVTANNQLTFPMIYGDGKAAEFICETMLGSVKY